MSETGRVSSPCLYGRDPKDCPACREAAEIIEGRVLTEERDGCGCLIAWEKLPNGHRVGMTVEECPKHAEPEDFDPADYVEVERP